MYQNIHVDYNHKKVHIWDDKLGYKVYPFSNFNHCWYRVNEYEDDGVSEYRTTIEGHRVKRLENPNWTTKNSGLCIEHDIPIETKALIKLYGHSDDISKDHNVMIFDIETEMTDEFPNWENPTNQLTSIAFHLSKQNVYVGIIVDENNDIEKVTKYDESLKCEVQIIPVDNEVDLIKTFLALYIEYKPTILVGWNSAKFDIPYMYNRIGKVLGYEYSNMLSPINQVYYDEYREVYKICGVSCLDYMELYKKFTPNLKSSYKLTVIGEEEINLGKVEYKGTLDKLFKSDINKYIEYNLRDVQIIKELDEKKKFIKSTMGICHKGHVSYENIFKSSVYIEGAILTYCNRNKIVTNNKPQRNPDGRGELKGAYVQPPQRGRYEWVYDLDLTSLYPSIIMSLNISPDTKIGKILNWNYDKWLKNEEFECTLQLKDGEEHVGISNDLKELLKIKNYSISSSGIIYDKTKTGLIPQILMNWFNERKEQKKLRDKYFGIDNELSTYYEEQQYTTKIMLNTVYGVLGLDGFRFFDMDNALSTTSTGQSVINHSKQYINEYYNKVLEDDINKNYVVYMDTDSCFVSAAPIIRKLYKLHPNDENEYISKTIEIASNVRDYINKKYDQYSKDVHLIDEHRFDMKQEFVSKAGIWIAKKRYAQMIVNKEGKTLSSPELDIKGIDVVRSNFPKSCKIFLKNIILEICNNKAKYIIDELIDNYIKTLTTDDFDDIAKPTGISQIDKFIHSVNDNELTKVILHTPVHVKAGLRYNDFVRLNNIKGIKPISKNEKIKWIYMKKNNWGIDVFGYRDIDEEPELIKDFIINYIDIEKMFTSNLLKKLNELYKVMSWGNITMGNVEVLNKYFMDVN